MHVELFECACKLQSIWYAAGETNLLQIMNKINDVHRLQIAKEQVWHTTSGAAYTKTGMTGQCMKTSIGFTLIWIIPSA